MPSEIMNQRRPSLLYAPSVPSSFVSDEVRFPTEVGFWKPESISDDFGTVGMPIMAVTSAPLDKKLQPVGLNSAKSLESHQMHFYEEQRAKLNIEHLRTERAASLFNTPWKSTDHDFSPQTSLPVQPTTMPANGSKVDLNAVHYESGLFSSSLSELFNKNVTLASSDTLFDKSIDTINSNIGEDEPFESLEEIEAQTIGNLLPDDDDLLEYISQPNNSDDVEEDIFCTVGGMEIEEIDSSGCNNDSELADRTINNQQGELNGPFAGEHPFGEHPSRTLFVRNINSNVEDSELRNLFEQYGDIRTLYTTCKHRGFVMVSYYDIRSACNAMRELQNKPLRRRKLDIHFSIPKDNPSEKDINQGTLVVFNLETSVSNDNLCQIFGAFGEIKEIRETPHKHHHKFIEFYDIRAAEAALHSLNRSDIAGKRIKLEPSRPGGSRRCSLQQLSPALPRDDVSGFHQQIVSPKNSPPEGFGTIPFGAVTSNGLDFAAVQDLHSVSRAPISSFVDSTFNGLPSSVPHNFSPVRSTSISNHSNQSAVGEPSHSLGQRNFGFQCMPNFHPHSLADYHENIPQGIPYNNSMSAMGIDIARSAEGVDNRHITISSAGFGIQNFEHAERAFGASGNGSYPLHGNQRGWSNSNTFHSPTGPVLWPNSPSFVNNIPCHPSSQLHGRPRTPHMLNTIPHVPHHHVGSAPTVNPSLWDRRHAYVGDPVDASAFHPGSLGSVGFSGSSPINPIELASRNIFSHIGGNFIEPPISSLHVGLSSPQQGCHMFHGRNGMITVPAAFDAPNDRGRSRRNEISSNQTDNKRQYELDIERIIRGEDSRTTLMIKNIPNKYTSKMLLAAIDELHRGTYDFIYLPIDFKNKCNVGYAFINMIDPQKIVPFHKAFNGKKWEKFNSEKVASLAYARIQGKAALIAHFQNSSLMNEDKRCRPILFHSDGPNAGDQEPFPMGVNIRSRPGRSRNHNNEDHLQDGSLSSANEEDNLNGILSFSGSTKDSE